MDDVEKGWVYLAQAQQLSRLLYPNPVCFLCSQLVANTEKESPFYHKAINGEHKLPPSQPAIKNVMVLSWLAPTNNEGDFMFSLCRRRFTATVLSEGSSFTLSIPTQGMEDMVREVGSISGRFGSKFPEDHHETVVVTDNATSAASASEIQTNIITENLPERQSVPLSKRQKKKLKRETNMKAGIQNLRRKYLSTSMFNSELESADSSSLFVVEGTIAHLVCTVKQILCDVLDDQHILVLAKTKRALVHKDYWNKEKHLFTPRSDAVPPFMTFFGSQTFGYTVCKTQQCNDL